VNAWVLLVEIKRYLTQAHGRPAAVACRSGAARSLPPRAGGRVGLSGVPDRRVGAAVRWTVATSGRAPWAGRAPARR
jgi:hypothetical protein